MIIIIQFIRVEKLKIKWHKDGIIIRLTSSLQFFNTNHPVSVC